MKDSYVFESNGFKAATFFILIFSTLVFSQNSSAFSNYSGSLDRAAKNLYGAAASYTFSCNGCHGASGYTLATQFGKDFKTSYSGLGLANSISNLSDADVQAIVKNFEAKDSDLDTSLNKAEFAAGTNPADSASKPAPVCVRGNPSLIFTANSLSTNAGSTVNFQLTLTNNDSSACANSTFSLLNTMPSGVSGQLSVASLILAPAGKQTFSLTVTPGVNLATGTYDINVRATNSGATSFFKDAAGSVAVTALPTPTPTPKPSATPAPTPTPKPSVTPTPVCLPKSPLVTINPPSQNAVPGDMKTFDLTISNLDSSACAAVNFAFSALPVANLNLALSKSSLGLSAGQSGTLTVSATVAANLAASQTLNFTININSAASTLHSVSVNSKLNVAVTTNIQDTEKPTEPTGVAVTIFHARARINWTPSTDNSGFVEYQVILDGKVVAETTRTTVRMRVRSGSTLIIRAIDPSGNYTDSKAFELSTIASGSADSSDSYSSYSTRRQRHSLQTNSGDD